MHVFSHGKVQRWRLKSYCCGAKKRNSFVDACCVFDDDGHMSCYLLGTGHCRLSIVTR